MQSPFKRDVQEPGTRSFLQRNSVRRRKMLDGIRKLKKKQQLWTRRQSPINAVPNKSMDTDIIVTLVRTLITCNSNREEDILGIVQQIRTIISFENNERAAKNIVETNGIEFFTALLGQYESPILQREAMLILSKICCSSVSIEVLHSPHFLQQIVNLLQSSEAGIRLAAACFVQDVASDNTEIRDQLLDLNVVDLILKNICFSHDDFFIAKMFSALSSLCQGDPQPAINRIHLLVYGAVEIILRKSSDHSFTMSVIQALTCIETLSNVENDMKRMEYVFQIGEFPFTQRIVQLLVDDQVKARNLKTGLSASLWVPAVQTLCNFCSGAEFYVQAVINAGVFAIFPEALGEQSTNLIRRLACCLVCKVYRKKAVDIEVSNEMSDIKTIVLGVTSLRHLFDLSKSGSVEWAVQREAIMASATIALAINGEQVGIYVAKGGIEILIEALAIKIDYNVVLLVLTALEKILQIAQWNGSVYGLIVYQAGGVEMIEHLANHGNESVSAKAEGIFQQFFSSA